MRVEILEDHADRLGKDSAAQALLGYGDHDSFQLDGAVVFAEAAQDHVGLQLARLLSLTR